MCACARKHSLHYVIYGERISFFLFFFFFASCRLLLPLFKWALSTPPFPISHHCRALVDAQSDVCCMCVDQPGILNVMRCSLIWSNWIHSTRSGTSFYRNFGYGDFSSRPHLLSLILLHSFTHSFTFDVSFVCIVCSSSVRSLLILFFLSFSESFTTKTAKDRNETIYFDGNGHAHQKWLPPSIPLGNVSALKIYNRREIRTIHIWFVWFGGPFSLIRCALHFDYIRAVTVVF